MTDISPEAVERLARYLDQFTAPTAVEARDAIRAQAQRIVELEGALKGAIEEVGSWGAYASDYFKDKHGLAKSIAELRTALEGKKP